MAYSFFGGVSVKTENKTKAIVAKPFAEPPQVAIPIFGEKSLVSVGDFVDIGTSVAINAHASVSGTVTAVEKRGENTFVVIKNDCRHTVVNGLAPNVKPIDALTAEEIISVIEGAGIVDSQSGKSVAAILRAGLGKAKRVVINCTESQPWQSSLYRVMTEQTEAVIKGIKILIYTLGVRKADIIVEKSNEKLISKIEDYITDKALIDIRQTTSKHPISQGSRLVWAVYNKRTPLGGEPLDIGYAIFTPETAMNVYRVLATGMPMIHKRVTVAGDCIKTPLNLIVPIGTSVKDVADFCGGTKKRLRHIVKGGAFMGRTVGEDAVIEKTDDSVLFMSAVKVERSGCVRCGKCIEVCPTGLTPSLLAAYSEKGLYSQCLSLGAEHCTGCGCCAYSCPSGIPIVSLIKKALKEVRNDDEQA